MTNLVKKLEARRIALDMPISCLAQRAGVHRNTVSRYFAGKSVNFGTMVKIAHALGVTLNWERPEFWAELDAAKHD